MPKAKAETNSNQLICETLTNHLSFDHLFQVCFLMNIFGKRSDLPFFRQEEKRVVSFYLRIEQNIICSQTQLDDIAHEQTIICRQLFAGHVVGFRPMKRKNNWSTQYSKITLTHYHSHTKQFSTKEGTTLTVHSD